MSNVKAQAKSKEQQLVVADEENVSFLRKSTDYVCENKVGIWATLMTITTAGFAGEKIYKKYFKK